MPKQKLNTLIKQLNEENAPPEGWTREDSVQETVPHVDVKEANRPEAGKTYALTGGPGSRCIANGFSWKDSEVQQEELQPKLGSRCS